MCAHACGKLEMPLAPRARAKPSVQLLADVFGPAVTCLTWFEYDEEIKRSRRRPAVLLAQRAVVARLLADTQGHLVFSARMLEAAVDSIAKGRERRLRKAEDCEDWKKTMARRWLMAFRHIQHATKRAKQPLWVKQAIGLVDGPVGKCVVGKVITVAEDGREASGSPGVSGTAVEGSPGELIKDEEEASQGGPSGRRGRARRKDSFGIEYFVDLDSELACPWRQVPGRREREYARRAVPDVDGFSPAIAKWDDGVAHPL